LEAPFPHQTRNPRALVGTDPPDLPIPPTYQCRRADAPPVLDGQIDDAVWGTAEWTAPFVAIEDGGQVALDSRLALLWDDDYLYAAYRFIDPQPNAVCEQPRDWVFLWDPDAELFLHGDGGYLEIGVNPIGTLYQIAWTWLEPVLERKDYGRLEALLMTTDFVYLTARPGELIGRFGNQDVDIVGLRWATHVGELPDVAGSPGRGWSVEYAIPWAGLHHMQGGLRLPPRAGDVLRMQAYRAHHDIIDPDVVQRWRERWGPTVSPFHGWTWAPQGSTDVHNPEAWVPVEFTD
jgi:hypothetical protein